MKKSIALSIALLFCFGGLGALGQFSPLKVEIQTARTLVKNKEAFSVSTGVRNTGSDAWELHVMSCSYSERWAVDSSSVHLVGDACEKNVPMIFRLKPGEAYERAVRVWVELPDHKRQPESVTFRLGFRDLSYGAAATRGGVGWSLLPPKWSNAVTVSVVK
jgi:hypothetical protein